MKKCNICPRMCAVDRAAGQAGKCRSTDKIRVARIAPHYWEEPCISGKNGSGALFFSGCTLGCVYCQNRKISRSAVGREMDISSLALAMLKLQGDGVHNINLVTPTHFAAGIKSALVKAKEMGLAIPVVYNTSGYDRVETLRSLEGLIDVYLPDFKYADSALAQKYSFAPDYPEVAKAAIDEMVRQTGKVRFDGDGMITRGVIVRHLALPGHIDDSMKITRYLHNRYGEKIYISLMNQYTPPSGEELPQELARPLSEDEYERLIDYAVDIGVEQAFVQEGGTVDESFIPEFCDD